MTHYKQYISMTLTALFILVRADELILWIICRGLKWGVFDVRWRYRVGGDWVLCNTSIWNKDYLRHSERNKIKNNFYLFSFHVRMIPDRILLWDSLHWVTCEFTNQMNNSWSITVHCLRESSHSAVINFIRGWEIWLLY